MTPEPTTQNTRQGVRRGIIMLLGAVAIALIGAWFLEGTVPRHAVIASGTEFAVNHLFAQRYAKILARDGIKLEERQTAGGAENLRLLLDRSSGVDLAIIPGGITQKKEENRISMLAALYYEPLWVFYRGEVTLTQLSDLRGKRVAVGSPDSSVRAFADPLLAVNDVSIKNTKFDQRVHHDALAALRGGEVDAIMLLGSIDAGPIWTALHEPEFKLMSIAGADAYRRRFSYISKLTLPPGSINFAKQIPAQEVQLIGTKAMLVARDDIAFPLVQLLLDAAREVHGMQGFFEGPAEFPNTMPVDIPVSVDAMRHLRFGPKMLQRYMPLVAASYLERVFILLVPLVVILIPLMEFAWQVYRTLIMRRIHRVYGELALLEREVNAAADKAFDRRLLASLESIERSAANIKVPSNFANDVYVLREHIKFVRREIMAKTDEQTKV